MKKTLTLLFACIAISGLMSTFSAKAQTITPKAPAISASLKPCIALYRQGNYLGAMQDLEDLVRKEPHNYYAKYYLALTYTKLGYKEEAKILYQEIADKNTNMTLTFYSQKAMECIGNPESEMCYSPKKQVTEDGNIVEKVEEVVELSDMDKFIQSGRQFHPAVTDRITKERMERRVQQQEYERKQQENQRKSDASMPTNEEIAAALNTLSKIGMNPFTQNNLQNQYSLNNALLNPMAQNANLYGAYLGNNGNNDIARMLMYNQMSLPQNNLMNYGI